MRGMSPSAVTQDLVKALRWRSPEYVYDATHKKKQLLLSWIEASVAASSEVTDELDAFLAAVDERLFDSFLFAPSVWQSLVTCHPELPNREFLSKLKIERTFALVSVRASKGASGWPCTPESWVWDALGARAIDRRNPDVIAFENFRTREGIVVDALSPHVRGPLPEIPTGSDDWHAEDFSLSLNKADAALALIQDVNPVTYEIVTRMIRVLAFKCDRRPAAGFVSATTDRCSGRPVLQNVHQSFVNVECIADALVHESIHTLFDTAEFYDEKIQSKHSPERIVSPWTGRSLDPNTYVQACYVWFGLAHFWATALRTGKCAAQAEPFFAKCCRGLKDGEFLGLAYGQRSIFHSEVLGSLEYIRDSFNAEIAS